jgi:hypothetical protein
MNDALLVARSAWNEFFAVSLICSALSRVNLPLLALDKISTSLSVSIEAMSSGVAQLASNSSEVAPKVSENKVGYSGNTRSSKVKTLRFKSEIPSTM